MYHPTTRVLTVLELLQARPCLSGAEIAERLEVSARSVRRYIAMLQDMGIPVEATPGRHGGYRLRPGYKLPPLMFNDEEALALVFGLLITRRLSLPVDAPAAEGALAKVERVLPEEVRSRVQALQRGLTLHLTPLYQRPESDVLAALSQGAAGCRPVFMRYRAYDGTESERTIEPYGVVYYDGRWYAVGFCRLRRGVRSFRIDRVIAAELQDGLFTPPEGFDSVCFLEQTVPLAPSEWHIEALLETSLDEARTLIPPMLAALQEAEGGVLFRCEARHLSWIAHVLVGLGCPVRVLQPPELRDELRRWAAHAAALAEQE
jgi:predicted DNA-binding transcriptional regulator YafY